MKKLLVTGANGHLGRRLLGSLPDDLPVVAVVRSESAAAAVRQAAGSNVEVHVLAYDDRNALEQAAIGCDSAVHFVGILKETRYSRYRDAHEATCEVLAEIAPAAGIKRVIALSIVGSSAQSTNACLCSKGRAEQILRDAPFAATVLQVPMVLGEGDYASRALAARGRKGFNLTFRAASLEQPIYAGDVVAAIVSALMRDEALDATLLLGGPECLPRRRLIERAASRYGRRTRVVSLPVGVGLALASLLERLLANPPVTPAMLDVLDHDDQVDTIAATAALGLTLTPLDTALQHCLAD